MPLVFSFYMVAPIENECPATILRKSTEYIETEQKKQKKKQKETEKILFACRWIKIFVSALNHLFLCGRAEIILRCFFLSLSLFFSLKNISQHNGTQCIRTIHIVIVCAEMSDQLKLKSTCSVDVQGWKTLSHYVAPVAAAAAKITVAFGKMYKFALISILYKYIFATQTYITFARALHD